MKGIIWSPKTLYWAWTIICMPKMNIMMPLTWTCVEARRDATLARREATDVVMKMASHAVDAISS